MPWTSHRHPPALAGPETRNLVHAAAGVQIAAKRQKKKAVVFSCSFGDGHRSAANAVQTILKDDFDVEIIDTTKDPRFLVNAWYTKAFGIKDEDLFNDLVLGHQWYALHNAFDYVINKTMGQLVKPCVAPDCNNVRKDQFRAALLALQPDLIVSVYHMELMPIIELAKELGNLPLLHIATDMDIKIHEVFGREGPGPSYTKFTVGVPFNADESYATMDPMSTARGGVEGSTNFLAGYPVRNAFLQPRRPQAELDALKRQRYPAGAKVVMIMTGGNGFPTPFPTQLCEYGFDEPLHIVVIAGKDTSMEKNLKKKLKGRVEHNGRTFFQGKSKMVTIEVARDPNNPDPTPGGAKEFYILDQELAVMMDMADGIITKPGGGTTAEVAYRGVPAVFDATKGLLHWEGFTVDLFVAEKRGVKLVKAGGIGSWLSGEKAQALQLKTALAEALTLGRSTEMAKGPDGELLDPAVRIREAALEVYDRECKGCTLFPSTLLQFVSPVEMGEDISSPVEMVRRNKIRREAPKNVIEMAIMDRGVDAEGVVADAN